MSSSQAFREMLSIMKGPAMLLEVSESCPEKENTAANRFLMLCPPPPKSFPPLNHCHTHTKPIQIGSWELTLRFIKVSCFRLFRALTRFLSLGVSRYVLRLTNTSKESTDGH